VLPAHVEPWLGLIEQMAADAERGDQPAAALAALCDKLSELDMAEHRVLLVRGCAHSFATGGARVHPIVTQLRQQRPPVQVEYRAAVAGAKKLSPVQREILALGQRACV